MESWKAQLPCSVLEVYPGLPSQVDGGLSASTIDTAAQAGANIVVAGTAIAGAADQAAAIKTLREGIDRHAAQ